MYVQLHIEVEFVSLHKAHRDTLSQNMHIPIILIITPK